MKTKFEFESSLVPIKSSPLTPLDVILPKDTYSRAPSLKKEEQEEQLFLFEEYKGKDDSKLGTPAASKPIFSSKNILNVDQYCLDQQFGVVKSDEEQFIIRTTGIGPCIGVMMISHDSDPVVAALVHADIRTNPLVLREMQAYFPHGAEFLFYGGSESPGSLETQRLFLKEAHTICLEDPQFKITTCMLYPFRQPSLDIAYNTQNKTFHSEYRVQQAARLSSQWSLHTGSAKHLFFRPENNVISKKELTDILNTYKSTSLLGIFGDRSTTMRELRALTKKGSDKISLSCIEKAIQKDSLHRLTLFKNQEVEPNSTGTDAVIVQLRDIFSKPRPVYPGISDESFLTPSIEAT